MKLEEKLSTLRKEKNLSQLELAETLGVSRQAISKWESGNSVPSVDNLKALGRIYEVPLEYLLHDDAPRPLRENAGLTEKHKERTEMSRHLLSIFVIVVLLATLLCVILLVSRKEPEGEISMDNIEGSEVETVDEDDFVLEF